MLIKKRLIILTVLPVVLSTLATSLVLIWTSQRLLFKRNFDNQKFIAERLSRELYINHFARTKHELLQEREFINLTMKAGYQALSLPLLREQLRHVFNEVPAITGLAVMNDSGWQEINLIRVGEEVVHKQDTINESGGKEFNVAMRDRVYISPVFIWQAANHIEMSVPIKDAHDRVFKVLKAMVNVERQWSEISGDLPAGLTGYLVDNRGNIIAHTDRSIMHHTRNISHLHIIQDFFSGTSCHYGRHITYENVAGKKVMGVYASIPEMGWALVVERPASEVYKPLYVVLAVGLGATFLLLAGFVSWGSLSAREIGDSVSTLKEGARRIGSGEIGYRLKIKTRDEYGQLGEELNRMASLLEERNKEVHKTNKEARALLHTFTSLIQAVSYSTSLEGVLLATLRNAIETTGSLGGEVFLFDEGQQEMRPFLSEGLDKEFDLAARRMHFKRGVGAPGKVYESGETVYLEDLGECPFAQRREVALAKGYVSALYVPLRVKEKIHGCIGVISKERIRYNPSLVSTLEAMGTIAASFLETAQNYHALEDKTQELSRKVETLRAMTEIDRNMLLKVNSPDELFEGVASMLGRLIPCDRVTIVMVDKVRGGFIYHYGWGTRVREKGDFVPFELTNTSQVVVGKKPILRNDLRQVEDLLPLDKQLLEEGFLSDLRLPVILENEVIGVLNVGSKRVAGFRKEDVSVAEAVVGQLAVSFSHARLIQELKASLLGTVRALSEAVDAKSHWTRGHSERVAELSCEIAERFGLEEEEVGQIRMASLLHDIGKIGIYEGILDKEGPLTPEEWKLVKEHCVKGVQIIRPVERFHELIPLILYHHERYDGKGYPEGLKGESIPLGARIIGLADAVDAMSSERPYRRAKPIQEVAQELKKNAGLQFCPRVVEIALMVL
jgi:putative nucleotidyltransferase with HDIG domain